MSVSSAVKELQDKMAENQTMVNNKLNVLRVELEHIRATDEEVCVCVCVCVRACVCVCVRVWNCV